MKERIASLMTVKSIITIMLTIVFCFMEMCNSISSDFMTIYTVIISFYFGTQATRISNSSSGGR